MPEVVRNSTPVCRGKSGPKPADQEDWAHAFIAALLDGASITKAAKRAGVHWTMVYQRRRRDEEFRKAWTEAARISTPLLAQEAQRRAFHGVLKPVFYKGIKCGYERQYSDNLLMFTLKARDPTKYRDNPKVTVNNTNNVVVGVFDDIVRDADLIGANAVPVRDLQADGIAEPIHEAQPVHAEETPEADRLPDGVCDD